MRSFHSKSWQDKIDPAFDSIIKSYMAFLDDCERLPDGYQSFIHLYEDLDLGDQWWSSENIKESRQENISQNEITIDEIGQDLSSIFTYERTVRFYYKSLVAYRQQGFFVSANFNHCLNIAWMLL